MTKLWKRIAAVMLAGMLTVSLAACGGNGNTSGTASDGGDTSGTAENSDTGSTDSGEIVKLVVWGTGTADTDDCNQVAEAVSEITREEIGVEIELCLLYTSPSPRDA